MFNNTDLSKITTEEATHKDTQIAKLENDLQKEKDSRKEERFYWIFAIIAIFDILVLPNASNNAGVFAIIIIELVFLISLAACSGLENISILLSNILSRFMDKGK